MPARSHKPRVLVPLTFGGAAEPKLPVVHQQAHAFKAQVVLLHVLDGVAPVLGTARSEHEREAHAFLDGVATRLREDGLRVQTDVRYGAVTAGVCDAAREHRASLVIVGAGARRGWTRHLVSDLGPAGAIAREAPCPVLIVPRADSYVFEQPTAA